MSIRQGRPEDYSKGPYLIVLDVAPCPLTSLSLLQPPAESLPLPYPSVPALPRYYLLPFPRHSWTSLLPIRNFEKRINSILRVSNSIVPFFLFRFTRICHLFLSSSSSLLLLSYPARRENTRIVFPLRGTEFHPSERNFRDGGASEPFLSLLRFECSPRGGCVSKRILDARLSLSLRGNFVMHFIYSQRQILIYRGGTGKCPRERGTQGPRPFPFSSFLLPLLPVAYSCGEREREREGPPSWWSS